MIANKNIFNRKFHNIFGSIFAFFFFLTELTGFLYSFMKQMGMDKKSFKILMKLHQMSILHLQSFYPILLGLGMIALTISGLLMSFFRKNRKVELNKLINCELDSRKTHHNLSYILSIPILLISFTGFLYRFLRNWLSVPKGNKKNQNIKKLSFFFFNQNSFLFSSVREMVDANPFLFISWHLWKFFMYDYTHFGHFDDNNGNPSHKSIQIFQKLKMMIEEGLGEEISTKEKKEIVKRFCVIFFYFFWLFYINLIPFLFGLFFGLNT